MMQISVTLAPHPLQIVGCVRFLYQLIHFIMNELTKNQEIKDAPYRIFSFAGPEGDKKIEVLHEDDIEKIYSPGGLYIPNPDFEESEPEGEDNPRIVEADIEDPVGAGYQVFLDPEGKDGPHPIEDVSEEIMEVEGYYDGSTWTTRTLAAYWIDEIEEITHLIGRDFEDRLVLIHQTKEDRGKHKRYEFDPIGQAIYVKHCSIWANAKDYYTEADEDEILEAQSLADEEFMEIHGEAAFPWISFPLNRVVVTAGKAKSVMLNSSEGSDFNLENLAEQKIADFCEEHQLEQDEAYKASYLLSKSKCSELTRIIRALQKKAWERSQKDSK